MKSLDIIYIGTLYPHPGGSAVLCSQLLTAFSRLGHRVRAIAPITTETLSQARQFDLAHLQIEFERTPVPYFETAEGPESNRYRTSEQKQITKVLTRMLGNRQPDVIFIGRENFAPLAVDFASQFAVPTLLIMHGFISHNIATGQCSLQAREEFLRVFANTTRIVTPGEFFIEPFSRLGINNIHYVPNSVDLSRFFPKEKDCDLLKKLSFNEDAIVALHASNLKTVKRTLDIVESARDVVRQEPRMRYLIVGDGQTRQEMEERCRDLGLSNFFRFVGWKDPETIPGYINVSDMVIVPSSLETQALIHLEAQACAKALIAGDIPASRAIVTDGVNGLLCKSLQPSELSEKTLLLARDSRLRQTLGQNARKSVLDHSLDRVADLYLGHLQAIAGEQGMDSFEHKQGRVLCR